LPLDSPAPEAPWQYTILVVDDEPAVRRAVFRALSEAGYRVFEASDGSEALVVLTRVAHRVDLVLTDVRMPGVDGAQLARELAEAWPEQRVLFMSGQPREVLEGYHLPETGVQLLQKPFTPDVLLARVRAYLRAGAATQLPLLALLAVRFVTG
jgi:two-component system cell cycle sensor histidine kinase/response regulator CckA